MIKEKKINKEKIYFWKSVENYRKIRGKNVNKELENMRKIGEK